MEPASKYVDSAFLDGLQGQIDANFVGLNATYTTANTAFDSYKQVHVAWWNAVDATKTDATQVQGVQAGTRCTASLDFNVQVPTYQSGFACDMTTSTNCQDQLDNYYSALTAAWGSFPATVTSEETGKCRTALESSWCTGLQTTFNSRWTKAEGLCGFGTDLNTFCNQYSTFEDFLKDEIQPQWNAKWENIECTSTNQKNRPGQHRSGLSGVQG